MESLGEFQYFEPTNLGCAVQLLSQLGEEASILAGGTDLLVTIRDGVKLPRYLVNIKTIPDLNEIKYDEGSGLSIGSLVTINKINRSKIIREGFNMIAKAAGNLGSYQIRNQATLGGNLCNASTAADMAPPLIAYDAKARIVGPTGEREVPLEEFFIGPGKTVLKPEMILKEVLVPNPKLNALGVYLKHGRRRAMEIATVNVAVLMFMHDDVCENVRIVLGSVAPTPLRVRKAEDEVRGKKLDDTLIERVAEAASRESRPISDIRASAKYRREMTKVFVRSALTQIWLKFQEAGVK